MSLDSKWEALQCEHLTAEGRSSVMQFEIIVLKLMKIVQHYEMDLVSWLIHWVTAWKHMPYIYIYIHITFFNANISLFPRCTSSVRKAFSFSLRILSVNNYEVNVNSLHWYCCTLLCFVRGYVTYCAFQVRVEGCSLDLFRWKPIL